MNDPHLIDKLYKSVSLSLATVLLLSLYTYNSLDFTETAFIQRGKLNGWVCVSNNMELNNCFYINIHIEYTRAKVRPRNCSMVSFKALHMQKPSLSLYPLLTPQEIMIVFNESERLQVCTI